jgi:hypothetical protein
MQISKADKVNCDNLIKLLRRAKIELEGAEEILGTAEVLRWMGSLAARIDKDLKDQDEAAKTLAAVASAKPIETMSPAPAPEKKARAKKGE